MVGRITWRGVVCIGLLLVGALHPTSAGAVGWLLPTKAGLADAVEPEMRAVRVLIQPGPTTDTRQKWFEVEFTGGSHGLAWVIPAAGDAQLSWGARYALDHLDLATAMRMQAMADDLAEGSRQGWWGGDDACGADWGWQGNNGLGVVGQAAPMALPDAATVMYAGGPQSGSAWIAETGYVIDPGVRAAMDAHLTTGGSLVVLRFGPGADRATTRPIIVQSTTSPLTVPLRRSAGGSGGNVDVSVVVISDGRATPANMFDMDVVPLALDWFDGVSNYRDVLKEAAIAAGGRAWITERQATVATVAGATALAVGERAFFRPPLAWGGNVSWWAASPSPVISNLGCTFNGADVKDGRAFADLINSSQIPITDESVEVLEMASGLRAKLLAQEGIDRTNTSQALSSNITFYGWIRWGWSGLNALLSEIGVDGALAAASVDEQFCAPLRHVAANMAKPLELTRLVSRLSAGAIDRELVLRILPVDEPVSNARTCWAAEPPGNEDWGRLTLPGLGTWLVSEDSILPGQPPDRFDDQPALRRASLYSVDGQRHDVPASQYVAIDQQLRNVQPGDSKWPLGLTVDEPDPPWLPPTSDAWLVPRMVERDLDGTACSIGLPSDLPRSPFLLLLALVLLLSQRRARPSERP